MKRRILCLVMAILLVIPACGAFAEEQVPVAKLRIAYPYGLSLAPMYIVQTQKLIEKHYPGEVEIEWQRISSGTAVNDALIADQLDVGFLGTSHALIGWSREMPYKIFTALSTQQIGLMCNDPSIKTLGDLTFEHKISVMDFAGVVKVAVSKALDDQGKDPLSLDSNMVQMSLPDATMALEAGSITARTATSTFLLRDLENPNLHEIPGVREAYPDGLSFCVGVLPQKLYDEQPELVAALGAAVDEAIDMLVNDIPAAAQIVCVEEGVTPEVAEGYLRDENSKFSRVPPEILEMADFMVKIGMLDKAPESLDQILYPELLALTEQEQAK